MYKKTKLFLLSTLILCLIITLIMGTENIVANEQVYYVRSGDSLYLIAQRFGISLTELRSANNLWHNHLLVGQRLIIPHTQSSNNYIQYRVQAGDSLFKIAQRYGVSITDIRQANNLHNDWIYVGQTLKIPQGNQSTSYVVRAGDSLFKIANQFGTTVANLRTANNLSSDQIHPGQTLTIPTGGQTNNTPSNYTIVIDPGHGGPTDPGAVGYPNGGILKESDLVLDISQRLATLLRQAGYNVVMTRNSDVGVDLWQRVNIANQNQADLFVSIHADSSPNYPQTGGSNIYISSNADWNTFQLADTVQRSLEQITGRPTNMLGRVIRRNFRVVVQSRPSILVETGFLTNPSDLRRFQTAEFRYLLARGIFNGINQWINSQ